MKCVIFSACIVALTLTGCGPPADADQATAQNNAHNQNRPAPQTTKDGREARQAGAPVKLYEEVKRLNTACVKAGGGVSGSPDCDAATVNEEQLEKLGYCIDYPNDEKLARCSDLTRRP